MDVKKLLPWNRRDIWNLSDCNGIRTHNRLDVWLGFEHTFDQVSNSCGIIITVYNDSKTNHLRGKYSNQMSKWNDGKSNNQ